MVLEVAVRGVGGLHCGVEVQGAECASRGPSIGAVPGQPIGFAFPPVGDHAMEFDPVAAVAGLGFDGQVGGIDVQICRESVEVEANEGVVLLSGLELRPHIVGSTPAGGGKSFVDEGVGFRKEGGGAGAGANLLHEVGDLQDRVVHGQVGVAGMEGGQVRAPGRGTDQGDAPVVHAAEPVLDHGRDIDPLHGAAQVHGETRVGRRKADGRDGPVAGGVIVRGTEGAGGPRLP